MRVSIGCATDKGNYRSKNQDRVMCCSKEVGEDLIAIACVCDGIGSFQNSEIAAEIITTGIERWFLGIVNLYPVTMRKDDLIEDLEVTIQELNELICEYREKNGIDIGCTMSVIFFINYDYYIFHVGDSRIYCFRNSFVQITKDEVMHKKIRGQVKTLLTNYVGRSKVMQYSKLKGIAEDGDIFVLGSDGLFKTLKGEDIQGISKKIIGNKLTEKACYKLIKTVLGRNEKDNISCAIVSIEKPRNFFFKPCV